MVIDVAEHEIALRSMHDDPDVAANPEDQRPHRSGSDATLASGAIRATWATLTQSWSDLNGLFGALAPGDLRQAMEGETIGWTLISIGSGLAKVVRSNRQLHRRAESSVRLCRL